MKNIQVTIAIFEVNDYVMTPCGVGIVTKVGEIHARSDNFKDSMGVFKRSIYMVQHKEPYSGNYDNHEEQMEDDSLILITKEEYEGE